MIREILFRGKRKDNGEWVEGDFCKPCNIVFVSMGYDEVLKRDNIPICNDCEVIPETVGQYTGLTDKNGNKIFEGDICSKFSNYSGKKICFPIVFEQGLFYAKYSETAGMPLCDVCEKVEVIGNIHDNPELLEGGAK